MVLICSLQSKLIDMQSAIFTQLSVDEIRQILREEIQSLIGKDSQNSSDESTILSFKEGCLYIGISESHGYKLTSTRQIPHAKRGKRIYFDRTELDQWILSKKVKTSTELASEANSILSKNRYR